MVTDQQRQFWLRPGPPKPVRSGDQTLDQARHTLVFSFQQAAGLDGVEVPDTETVLAELDRFAALENLAERAGLDGMFASRFDRERAEPSGP